MILQGKQGYLYNIWRLQSTKCWTRHYLYLQMFKNSLRLWKLNVTTPYSSGRLHNCMAFHLLNLHSHFPFHQNLVAGALELDQQLFAIWWLQRGWNTAHVATAFPLSLSVNKTKILLVLETLAMGQDMYLFQWGWWLGVLFLVHLRVSLVVPPKTK